MSPAGLKGVAEEAGLELVVVCGAQHGRHLPPQRVQPRACTSCRRPEAVADAQDGDALAFDPDDARGSSTRRAGSATTPVPLTAKEEEIRRTRRHLRGRPPRVPRRRSSARRAIALARRRDRARGITTTEQIVWAHRVDQAGARCGRARRCASTPTCCPPPDGTAPFSIHTFNQITGGDAIWPRQIAIANDHFVFTGVEADERQTAIGRAFAQAPRPREALLRDPGRRHLPLLLPRAGPGACPAHGDPRRRLAQPRLRRLRRDRHRRGLDHARLRLVHRLHLLRRSPSSAASRFTGELQPWVSGKDIVLELLRRWGAKQSQGMSVEFVDASGQLPIAYRNTICQHDGRGRGAATASSPPTTSP